MVDAKILSPFGAVGETRTPTIFRSLEPESRESGPRPEENDSESFSGTRSRPFLLRCQREGLTRKRNVGSAALSFLWRRS